MCSQKVGGVRRYQMSRLFVVDEFGAVICAAVEGNVSTILTIAVIIGFPIGSTYFVARTAAAVAESLEPPLSVDVSKIDAASTSSKFSTPVRPLWPV